MFRKVETSSTVLTRITGQRLYEVETLQWQDDRISSHRLCLQHDGKEWNVPARLGQKPDFRDLPPQERSKKNRKSCELILFEELWSSPQASGAFRAPLLLSFVGLAPLETSFPSFLFRHGVPDTGERGGEGFDRPGKPGFLSVARNDPPRREGSRFNSQHYVCTHHADHHRPERRARREST
ncbi:hypothetical protein TgHK011_004751 [Trichoderma gracile]|nr:hypothetical protein TgHK011_004751 [Trichoderma gracile]